MINTIMGDSRWLNAQCHRGNYPYIQNPQEPAGMMRFNTMQQRIEVFDGSRWVELGGGHAQINLSEEAIQTLEWARRKMDEEKQLQSRMERMPGLKDAYEQFKIMDILSMEHNKKEGA